MDPKPAPSVRDAGQRAVEQGSQDPPVLPDEVPLADGEGQAWPERVAELTAEVVGLHKALESRAVIEQAKGILMAKAGVTPEEAFELLVRQSTHENRKLRDIAAELVERTVRR